MLRYGFLLLSAVLVLLVVTYIRKLTQPDFFTGRDRTRAIVGVVFYMLAAIAWIAVFARRSLGSFDPDMLAVILTLVAAVTVPGGRSVVKA